MSRQLHSIRPALVSDKKHTKKNTDIWNDAVIQSICKLVLETACALIELRRLADDAPPVCDLPTVCGIQTMLAGAPDQAGPELGKMRRHGNMEQFCRPLRCDNKAELVVSKVTSKKLGKKFCT